MNNKEKELLREEGRHQIADPMNQKIKQWEKSIEDSSKNVENLIDEVLDIVDEKIIEDKNNNLGIKKFVNFSDLSEDHDRYIVLALIRKYYKEAINNKNENTDSLVNGLHNAASIIGFNDTIQSYSVIEETEDQEEVSKILWEVICLLNNLAGENNEDIVDQVLDELTISRKETKQIREFIESNYLVYGLQKWIDFCIGDYYFEGDNTDLEDISSYNENEIENTNGDTNEIDLDNIKNIVDSHISEMMKIEGFWGLNTKASLTNYAEALEKIYKIAGKCVASHCVIAYYQFPKDQDLLITYTGVWFLNKKNDSWYNLKFADYREEYSSIKHAASEKFYSTITLNDSCGNEVNLYLDESLISVICSLLSTMKDIPTPKNDTITRIVDEECSIRKLYGELFIDFLKLNSRDSFYAIFRYQTVFSCNSLIAKEEIEGLVDYWINSPILNESEFLNKVDVWYSQLEYSSANYHISTLVENLVELVQLSSGKTREMSLNEVNQLKSILYKCGEQNAEDFINVVSTPYRLMKNDITFDSIKDLISKAKKITHIPYYLLNRDMYYHFELIQHGLNELPLVASKQKKDELIENLQYYSWAHYYLREYMLCGIRILNINNEEYKKNAIDNYIMCLSTMDIKEDIMDEIKNEIINGNISFIFKFAKDGSVIKDGEIEELKAVYNLR